MSERKSVLEQELAAAKGDLSEQATETPSLLTARASLAATLASEREATKEKLQLCRRPPELENSFQALANSALRKQQRELPRPRPSNAGEATSPKPGASWKPARRRSRR